MWMDNTSQCPIQFRKSFGTLVGTLDSMGLIKIKL